MQEREDSDSRRPCRSPNFRAGLNGGDLKHSQVESGILSINQSTSASHFVSLSEEAGKDLM